MKQKFKALLAILLAGTMVLGLAACGNRDTAAPPSGGIGGENQGTVAGAGYVYVPEFIDVQFDASSMELIAVSGDTLYISYRVMDGGSGIGVIRTDGSDARSIWEGENRFWEEGDVTHSEFQELMARSLHPDGGLLVARHDYGGFWGPEESSFEESFALMHISSDGAVLREGSLNQALNIPEGDWFGVNSLQVLSDGRVIISTWDTLYLLATDWTLDRQMDLQANNLIVTADDQILVSVWREGADGSQVFPFDLETGEIDESNGSLFTAELHNTVIGSQYDLYVGTHNAVYGFDLATRRSTLLFDWLDIDMISSYVFAASETGEIYFFEQNWDDRGGEITNTLIRLTRRPISEVPQRTEIIFGSLSVDWELRREIINFNQRSQNYRIRVREYWDWMSESQEEAITRLNTDIITGNAPDIIDFGLALSFERYARRGFLADIGALLDGDAELSRGDMVENIRNLMEVDGTLYTVASQFAIQTLVGRSDRVGTEMGWTMAQFMDMADGLPPGNQMFDEWITRQQFMNMIFAANLGQFIDRETGGANFDSPLFRSYLEFARSLPTDDDLFGGDGMWPGDFARPAPLPLSATAMSYAEETDDYTDIEPIDGEIEAVPPIIDLPQGDWENPYATGQVVLQDRTLFGFMETQFMEEQFGAPVTFIGFPSEQGIGSAMTPRTILGISATSRNIDAAWSFVRTILTPQYQRQNIFQFATNQTVFNEQIAEAMADVEPMWEGDPGRPGATQAQIDQILAIINQTGQLYMWDQTVLDMITEETLAFFAGDRSVEETARIIQSRVQTYLSERG